MPRYLLPGENLVVTVHRHWIVLLQQLLLPALLVVAVLAVTLVVTLPGEVRLLVTLAGLAAGGLWMIVGWVRWSSISLTVTEANDRAIALYKRIGYESTRVFDAFVWEG